MRWVVLTISPKVRWVVLTASLKNICKHGWRTRLSQWQEFTLLMEVKLLSSGQYWGSGWSGQGSASILCHWARWAKQCLDVEEAEDPSNKCRTKGELSSTVEMAKALAKAMQKGLHLGPQNAHPSEWVIGWCWFDASISLYYISTFVDKSECMPYLMASAALMSLPGGFKAWSPFNSGFNSFWPQFLCSTGLPVEHFILNSDLHGTLTGFCMHSCTNTGDTGLTTRNVERTISQGVLNRHFASNICLPWLCEVIHVLTLKRVNSKMGKPCWLSRHNVCCTELAMTQVDKVGIRKNHKKKTHTIGGLRCSIPPSGIVSRTGASIFCNTSVISYAPFDNFTYMLIRQRLHRYTYSQNLSKSQSLQKPMTK